MIMDQHLYVQMCHVSFVQVHQAGENLSDEGGCLEFWQKLTMVDMVEQLTTGHPVINIYMPFCVYDFDLSRNARHIISSTHVCLPITANNQLTRFAVYGNGFYAIGFTSISHVRIYHQTGSDYDRQLKLRSVSHRF